MAFQPFFRAGGFVLNGTLHDHLSVRVPCGHSVAECGRLELLMHGRRLDDGSKKGCHCGVNGAVKTPVNRYYLAHAFLASLGSCAGA